MRMQGAELILILGGASDVYAAAYRGAVGDLPARAVLAAHRGLARPDAAGRLAGLDRALELAPDLPVLVLLSEVERGAARDGPSVYRLAQALAREILDVNPEITAEAAAGQFVTSLLGDDRAAEWRVALRKAGLP